MLRTRSPVYSPCGFLPRLACVRHAASVRSEPGSNSPIEIGGRSFGTPRRVWGTPMMVSPALLLTHYKLHSKHCGIRNLLLRGLPIRFSKTERHCTADDQLPPPAVSGGARFLPLSAARVKGLRFRPRSRPTAAGGASCNTLFRRCQEPAARPLTVRWNLGMPQKIPRPAGACGRRDTPPCCRAPRWLPDAPLSLRETRSAAYAGTIRSRRP